MKDINQDKQIEKVLSSFKPNDTVFLAASEKENILNNVFERAERKEVYQAVKTPFNTYSSYFTQYLRYSIPVIAIIFIGSQLFNIFNDKSKLAISNINNIKSTVEDIKRENEIKINLSKNRQDIQELKSSLGTQSSSVKTEILANQLSNRSKEIRNQVASLVSENKISEAKKVALDLETALKADELYKVSTSVESEVFASIDLRVDIEKKEYKNISSSTESDVLKRIDDAKSEIKTFEANASTTDMIKDAEKSIETAEKYVNDKDLENAIISLQLYDRIVAELKNILLP